MKKYETKIIAAEKNVGEATAQLDGHGEEGWHVTAYIPQPAKADMIILQREIEEEGK